MIPLFETGQPLRFAADGLIPAIIQDSITKNVLMLGYMNEEAISLTRSTGLVTFFSRSRQKMWQKGEESGNVLHAKEMRTDCDGDALLVLASPVGPTCHTGTDTCWAEANDKSSISFLAELEQVIEARIEAGDDASYTMRLINSGVKRISQKVGEEGLETALEGVVGTNEKLSEEAADLIYHLLVLLQARDLRLADVVAVLQVRHSA